MPQRGALRTGRSTRPYAGGCAWLFSQGNIWLGALGCRFIPVLKQSLQRSASRLASSRCISIRIARSAALRYSACHGAEITGEQAASHDGDSLVVWLSVGMVVFIGCSRRVCAHRSAYPNSRASQQNRTCGEAVSIHGGLFRKMCEWRGIDP